MGVNKDTMLNEKNIVLRGSILKETNFIIGVALYTGVDSKVMLNSVNNKQKKGKVERITNKFILLIGVFIICLCLGLSILNYYKEREFNLLINNDFSWPQQLFTNFGQWILVFTSIVPIALICSLELVKQF
jgi:magnesium-transporting ATPase (P-type)